MVTLTVTCERCGETKEVNLTGRALSDEHIRMMGFGYVCDKIICKGCQDAFVEHKEQVAREVKQRECEFFNHGIEGKKNEIDDGRGRL